MRTLLWAGTGRVKAAAQLLLMARAEQWAAATGLETRRMTHVRRWKLVDPLGWWLVIQPGS
jgi:hypothetical protein